MTTVHPLATTAALNNAIGDAIAASLTTGHDYAAIAFNEAPTQFYALSRQHLLTTRFAPHRRVTPFYNATLTTDGYVSVVNKDN